VVAVLAIGNVGISILTESARGLASLRRVGLAAFVFDIALVTALVWTYATPQNSLWVIAYVLPLEGALRFGLVGALAAVAVAAVSEPLRQVYVADRLGVTLESSAPARRHEDRGGQVGVRRRPHRDGVLRRAGDPGARRARQSCAV
jgi:hypothetical protein